LNPQNRGFSEFFAILGYGVHCASEFSPKLLEIDKTTCVRNYTDAVARLMSVSSDFLFLPFAVCICHAEIEDTNFLTMDAGHRRLCKEHQRSIEYVCQTDGMLICAHCAILGPHRGDLGHKVSPIDKLMEKATAAMQELQLKSKIVESLLQESSTKESHQKKKVESHFDKLVASLMNRKQSIMDELSSTYQQHMSELQQLLTRINKNSTHLQSFLSADIALSLSEDDIDAMTTSGDTTALQAFTARFICNKELEDGLKTHGKILLHTGPAAGVPGPLPSVDSICQDNSSRGSISEDHSSVKLESVSTTPIKSRPVFSVMADEGRIDSKSVKPQKISKPPGFETELSERVVHESSSSSNLVVTIQNEEAPSDRTLPQTSVMWSTVFIQYIRSPSYFVIQYEEDVAKIEQLSVEINLECNKPMRSMTEKELQPDMLVLALYADDGRWYRASVTRVLGHQLEVELIDFGTVSCVSAVDGVQRMPSNFRAVPRLSTVCRLDAVIPCDHDERSDWSTDNRDKGCDWSADAKTTFVNMTSTRAMMMKVNSRGDDGMANVSLAWPLLDEVIADSQIEAVSDALVALRLAKHFHGYDTPTAVQTEFTRVELPQCGQSLKAAVTHVINQHQFYIQQCSEQQKSSLKSLMEQIQSVYSDENNTVLYRLRVPTVGLPCVAQFSADGNWYRAEVIDVKGSGGGLVKVLYVDYGNCELLPLDCISKLLQRFLLLPAQALRCSLAQSVDSETFSSSAQVEYLSVRMAKSQPVHLNVVDILPGSVLSVSVEASQTSTAARMLSPMKSVSAAVAAEMPVSSVVTDRQPSSVHTAADSASAVRQEKKTTEVRSKRISLVISHAVSPSEIYLQHATSVAQNTLNKLMTQLQSDLSADSTKPPSRSNWKIGDECAALRDDGRWYRAKIIDIKDDLYVVHLGDYGYKEWLGGACLQPIRRELLKIPWSAQKCHLVDICPLSGGDSWPQKTCEELFAVVIGKKCVIQTKAKSDCVEQSLAVDVLLKDTIRGTALAPDQTVYRSVSEILVQKQLAQAKTLMPLDTAVHRASSSSSSSRSPSLTSPLRPIQQQPRQSVQQSPATNKPTYSQPSAVSATNQPTSTSSYADPGIVPAQSQSEDLQATGHLANVSANSRLQNLVAVSHCGGMSAASQLSSSHGVGMSTVVPLPADFKPPGHPKSANITAVATHVDEQCHIYVHELHSDLSQLASLDKRLHERYYHSSPDPDVTWSLGSAVAAYYAADDMYYRAKIAGFDDDGIKVVYVDFGNSEVVSKSDLRMLDAEFMSDPVHCYCCILYDLSPIDGNRWCREAVDVVTNLLIGKNCTLTIRDTKGDVLVVEVFLSSNRSLADVLCTDRLAIRTSDMELPLQCGSSRTPDGHSRGSSDVEQPPYYYVPPPVSCVELPQPRQVGSQYTARQLPGLDDYLFVTVTQIDSPATVYLQHTAQADVEYDDNQNRITAELDMLLAITNRYTETAERFKPLPDEQFCPGTACVAQYSVDGRYYRAEIVCLDCSDNDVGGARAGLRFVDYGSFEYVPHDNLRAIPAGDLTLPSQSVRCHLAGITAATQAGLSEADIVQAMWQVLAGKPLLAVVKGVSYYDEEITVDLFDQLQWKLSGVNTPLVYRSLIDDGLLSHTDTDYNNIDYSDSGSSVDDI